MAKSVTLSSVGTATIVLDPTAKATTVMLSASSSGVSTVQVDMSLDDPTIVSGPTTTWALLSSAAAMTSSNNVFGSGMVWTVLSPVGMVRVNSSVNATTFTLKALQSVTA